MDEITDCMWLFLTTDMMMLPDQYKGHKLIEIGTYSSDFHLEILDDPQGENDESARSN